MIHDSRIEDAFADDVVRITRGIQAPEETAAIPFMARRSPDLFDLDEQRVGVTVEEDFLHDLDVATFFTLAPQLITTAAEIADLARLQSFFPGRTVHVGQHQDIASGEILGDDRNQFELFKIRTSHGQLSLSKTQ